MLPDNDRISNIELLFLMTGGIIETGILSSPRFFAQEAASDAWLATAFSLLPALVSVFFIVRLNQLFPGESIFFYGEKILGKLPGRLLTLALAIYWVINCSRVLRTFADMIKIALLFRTPIEVITLIFLVLSAYLARGGLEPIARFTTIAVIASLPIGILLVFATYTDWDFTNFLPVLENGWIPAVRSGCKFLGRLEGLESLLVLLAFVRKPQKALTYSLVGITIVIFMGFLMTCATLLSFGPIETTRLITPGISLIQIVNLPGRFLERLGSVYLTIWILILYPTIVLFLYLSGLACAKIGNFSEYRSFVLTLVPFVYLISLLPENISQVFKMAEVLGILNITVIGLLPVTLYTIARLRGFKPGGK